MKYLLLECSNIGRPSEYVFWSNVVGFSGTILRCSGSQNLLAGLNKITSSLVKGDSVYVCFDYINTFDVGSVADRCNKLKNTIINTLNKMKTLYGINCYMSKELCFESMLYRMNIIEVDSNMLKLRECLNDKFNCRKSNYSLNSLLDSIKKDNFIVANTYEQCLAKLLHNITYPVKGLIVDKDNLGGCWYCDCGIILERKTQTMKPFCYFRGRLNECHLFDDNSKYDLCLRLVNKKSKTEFDFVKDESKLCMILTDIGVNKWEDLFESVV